MTIIQQGWNQMPAAVRNIISGASAVRRGVRKLRRKSKRKASPSRSKRASRGKRKSLVKGSAAAKAWGRKMKAMRKKKHG